MHWKGAMNRYASAIWEVNGLKSAFKMSMRELKAYCSGPMCRLITIANAENWVS